METRCISSSILRRRERYMGVLSDKLKYGVVGEVSRAANEHQRTVAVVTKADEPNNVCSIQFLDRDGKKRDIRSAQVALSNKDWFPNEGDTVLIDVDGSRNALILQQYTEDYNKDVRNKRAIRSDVMPSGDGTCGGTIF